MDLSGWGLAHSIAYTPMNWFHFIEEGFCPMKIGQLAAPLLSYHRPTHQRLSSMPSRTGISAQVPSAYRTVYVAAT